MEKTKRKEETYSQLALAHARAKGLGGRNQPYLPTIKPGSPEWSAWQRYFNEHLGFQPYAMTRIEGDDGKEFTVPANWPWEFDGSYSAPKLIAAA